jgi:hypothetical protein
MSSLQKARFGSNDFPGQHEKAYSGIGAKVFRMMKEVS